LLWWVLWRVRIRRLWLWLSRLLLVLWWVLVLRRVGRGVLLREGCGLRWVLLLLILLLLLLLYPEWRGVCRRQHSGYGGLRHGCCWHRRRRSCRCL
jgi:hypothetical protein